MNNEHISGVLKCLAAEYPQLYLNPDADLQEAYRRVVLRGEMPEQARLAHYIGDEYDSMETVDTPAGQVRVVSLGCRRDFELVMRGMMAAKDGPQAMIPASQGAAMLTVFNWPRIKAIIDAREEAEPFTLISSLMEQKLME